METPTPVSGRKAVVWVVVFGVLAAAVAAAVVAGPSGGGLALGIATLSAHAANAIQPLGDRLPLGYALAAGMAAAVNPCGFALLPAYLGLYLGTSGQGRGSARSIGRALVVGATMTAGFVALFGLAGLALGAAATVLADLLPWLSLLIGVLLTLIGGRMLAGGAVHVPVATRLSSRIGGVTRRMGLVGYAGYGVAFALTSLGCTLPLFLTVVATALTAGGLGAAATQFVLYALGMGLVVTGATVLVALFGRALVARASGVGRYLQQASAVLLLLTGAYVVYYWLTVGGLLG